MTFRTHCRVSVTSFCECHCAVFKLFVQVQVPGPGRRRPAPSPSQPPSLSQLARDPPGPARGCGTGRGSLARVVKFCLEFWPGPELAAFELGISSLEFGIWNLGIQGPGPVGISSWNSAVTRTPASCRRHRDWARIFKLNLNSLP